MTRALVDPGVRDRNLVGKHVGFGARKAFWYILWRPYRKPTQVDGMRILRPTGEG